MNNVTKSPTMIHIGLPRCGSTYLKRKCFCRTTKNVVVPRGKLLKAVCASKFDAASFRNAVLSEQTNPDELLIVTNEAFSGDMLSSRYSETVAENLYSAFPDGKIVIFLREQFSLLRSIYLFGVSKGTQTQSLEQFTETHGSLLVEKLQYDRLIQWYQERYGKDQVDVFLFEMIQRDEPLLHEALKASLGAEYQYASPEERKNSSINDQRTIAIMRKSNLLMKWVVQLERKINHATWTNHHRIRDVGGQLSLQTPVAGLIRRISSSGKKIEVPEEFKKTSTQPFRESNQRVIELTGLPLNDYGYLT